MQGEGIIDTMAMASFGKMYCINKATANIRHFHNATAHDDFIFQAWATALQRSDISAVNQLFKATACWR